MPKGLIIGLDGGDGSGKATQTSLLVERLSLESPPVQTFSFPRYETPTGRLIRQFLNGMFGDPTKVSPEFSSALFGADRLAAAPEIVSARDSGKHVILDRYVPSNMGHQGSKIADDAAREAYYAWLDHYEYVVNGIPRTDLQLILHVPAEVSMELIRKRGKPMDLHETLAHLKAAERTYQEICARYDGFKLIECVENGELLPVEAIHEKVWQEVSMALARQKVAA